MTHEKKKKKKICQPNLHHKNKTSPISLPLLRGKKKKTNLRLNY